MGRAPSCYSNRQLLLGKFSVVCELFYLKALVLVPFLTAICDKLLES